MKKILIASFALLVPSLVSAATLSISPSTQSVNVGDTFTVSVNLNTQTASIDGVDLKYLTFNPAILQVQDANSGVSGVQITPGSLMSATLINRVDNTLGRVTFSQVNGNGTRYTGSGTLATISFRALSAGNATVSFNYTANSTTDSNVASQGSDVLSSVSSGSFTVNSSLPDTTLPVISITSPTANSTVSGSQVPLSASASDPTVTGQTIGGVSTVRFKLDGVNIDPILTTPTSGSTYSATWNTIGISNGTHTLTVEATDVSNNKKTSNPVTITISNTVVVTNTNPGGGGAGGDTTNTGTITPLVVQRPLVLATTTTIAPNVRTSLSTSPFSRSLTLGSTGADVKALQQFLNSKGYTIAQTGLGSRGNESTYFGPATAKALARFQLANSITPASGYFGNLTMSKIKSLSSTGNYLSTSAPVISTPTITNTTRFNFTRSLTIGSTGADVKQLQIFLNSKGYTIAQTGLGSKGKESTYFGPATKSALIRYQKANNITPASGFFGPLTRGVVNR